MGPYRINVIGASGSGASTTGRAIAARLSIPYFDSDDYFHGPSDPPFQNPRDPGSRHDRLVRDISGRTSFVLGGGVDGWEPYPELRFTLVVFLWVPLEVRMPRLRAREQERFGARIDPGGDMHESHEEFVAWAARYDAGDVEGKTLSRHEAWLAEQSCPVVEIRGTPTTAEAVDRVLSRLG